MYILQIIGTFMKTNENKFLLFNYFFINLMIIIITVIIIWSPLCKAGREWEHSISPKTPTPHNQPLERRR